MERMALRPRQSSVRMMPAAAAALTTLALCSCTADSEPEGVQESPAPAVSTTAVSATQGEPADAPPGYKAFLIDTRMRGTVLSVRTVGSSACPFEVDTAQAVGTDIELTDEPDRSHGGVCTADASPSNAYYSVSDDEVGAFSAAESVVITTLSGDRLRMSLSKGVE